MDEAELARIRRLVHSLCCRDRLSPELAAQRLTAYQLELSPGAIRGHLAVSRCASCPDLAAQAVPQERPPASVHRGPMSGYLTGMIDG